jgi:hypothetical protein
MVINNDNKEMEKSKLWAKKEQEYGGIQVGMLDVVVKAPADIKPAFSGKTSSISGSKISNLELQRNLSGLSETVRKKTTSF